MTLANDTSKMDDKEKSNIKASLLTEQIFQSGKNIYDVQKILTEIKPREVLIPKDPNPKQLIKIMEVFSDPNFNPIVVKYYLHQLKSLKPKMQLQLYLELKAHLESCFLEAIQAYHANRQDLDNTKSKAEAIAVIAKYMIKIIPKYLAKSMFTPVGIEVNKKLENLDSQTYPPVDRQNWSPGRY